MASANKGFDIEVASFEDFREKIREVVFLCEEPPEDEEDRELKKDGELRCVPPSVVVKVLNSAPLVEEFTFRQFYMRWFDDVDDVVKGLVPDYTAEVTVEQGRILKSDPEGIYVEYIPHLCHSQTAMTGTGQSNEDDDDDDDDLDDDRDESYLLSGRDWTVLKAAKVLLWKIVRSPLVNENTLPGVAQVLQSLHRLPRVTPGLDLRIMLTGPRRHFGRHEIYHYWEIQVCEDEWTIQSGGNFYRPETGNDTFTALTWFAVPGRPAEYDDYLASLRIVDDAQPFPAEVAALDLHESGFKLELEGSAFPDESDEDAEDEADEMPDDATMAVWESEQALMRLADLRRGRQLRTFADAPPEDCDFCGADLGERTFFVNGKVRGSFEWGFMCSDCFQEHGEAIGWGKGQLYLRLPNGRWLLVGGFPPE